MRYFIASVFALAMSFAYADQGQGQGQAPQKPTEQKPVDQKQAPMPPQKVPAPAPKVPEQGKVPVKAPEQGKAPAQGQAQAPAKAPEQAKVPEQGKTPAQGQTQARGKEAVGMDQQGVDLITQDSKGKMDAPEYMVVKIDQDTGAKSVYYPNKTLVDGADVSSENFEAVNEFDGSTNMMESTESHFTTAAPWNYRWYHNRSRNHSLRIGFNPLHPWSSYWGRSYGPVYRYNDYYDRPYRFRYNHYRPYYYYNRGSGLYFSVRLQP